MKREPNGDIAISIVIGIAGLMSIGSISTRAGQGQAGVLLVHGTTVGMGDGIRPVGDGGALALQPGASELSLLPRSSMMQLMMRLMIM